MRIWVTRDIYDGHNPKRTVRSYLVELHTERPHIGCRCWHSNSDDVVSICAEVARELGLPTFDRVRKIERAIAHVEIDVSVKTLKEDE